jgi:hypothetical protein
MEEMKVLILMYSVLAVFMMNLTYKKGYILSCPVRFCLGTRIWKILYCAVSRTKKFLTAVCD